MLKFRASKTYISIIRASTRSRSGKTAQATTARARSGTTLSHWCKTTTRLIHSTRSRTRSSKCLWASIRIRTPTQEPTTARAFTRIRATALCEIRSSKASQWVPRFSWVGLTIALNLKIKCKSARSTPVLEAINQSSIQLRMVICLTRDLKSTLKRIPIIMAFNPEATL